MPNEASNRLKRSANKIMKMWEDRATNEVMAAFKMESLALQNTLPELLALIADALSTTIDRSEARVIWDHSENLRVGKKHGHERAISLDYTMDQMIFEYHILREVICDVMEEEELLSPVEREVIVCAIEQSVNAAATQFSETLRGIQEKVASALSHDLRSPILIAKMTAQLLVRNKGDIDYSISAANRICKNMDLLDSMIHELLDASVIRAGKKLPLKIEEFDLSLLIQEFAQELNLIYNNRIVVIHSSPIKGFWSKNGLRRVIENLVTNAVKYGDPKTPITISIKESGSKIILSIHNVGPSIPVEEQSMLFRQFHRTPSSRTEIGWGLGLSVVKSITEEHGGKVGVESRDNKGTTFTVELPQDARETASTNIEQNQQIA